MATLQIDRSDELRVAFRAIHSPNATVTLTPRLLFHTLKQLGLHPLTVSMRSALIESFSKHGGFTEDDFVQVAQSLGYAELADRNYGAAVAQMTAENNGLVDMNELERLVRIYGAPLKLSSAEVKAFLLFQLGEKQYVRPQLTKDTALQLIN